MFKFFSVSQVIPRNGAWVGRWPNQKFVLSKPEVSKNCLTESDTGVLIFSLNQKEELSLFQKEKTYKILYKSKPAYNSVHPGAPRNTVVVFELAK